MSRQSQFADLPTSDFRKIVERHVEVVNEATKNIDPDQMRLHLCWGNYEGPHHMDVPMRDIVDIVPPSAKHLNQVLHGLDRAVAKGRGSLAVPLLKVSESQHRRSILLILSDLYEPADKIRDALGPLRDAGHDVVVMHLLDPAELNFTFDAAGTFEDLESGERIPVVPGRLRTRYTELIRDHLTAVEKLLGEGRVDYLMVDTSKPVDEILFQYLLRRERMQSVR